MTDRGGGPCCNDSHGNVCIDVNRVYDCCKDRDCIVDMRVYIPQDCQNLIDRAINVKAESAEIIWVYINVEQLPFNKGFYTVDVKFFIKVMLEVFVGMGRPQRIEGLGTFDKRVILYGSEGGAKMFSSQFVPQGPDMLEMPQTNLPVATVEAVDPVVLCAKLVDAHEHFGCCEMDLSAVPQTVVGCFTSNPIDPRDGKRVYVTIGLFSIIRLMRRVQILVPGNKFCIPEKECTGPCEEDPCHLFYKMPFPIDEFFPPQLEPGCPGGKPC